MKLSLVIPTYNEKKNLPVLIKRIDDEFKAHSINGEVVVVDDNSPDGTGKTADDLCKKYPFLKVIHRSGKLGLSSAVLDGFKKGTGDVLGVMDADLSHPPEKLHEMMDAIKNIDLVIGSRYMKGGRVEGWPLQRKIISLGAILLARGFTPVKDTMSGFFLIHRRCFKGRRFNPKGFKILLELIIKADVKTIEEVPITFINRAHGISKADVKEIIYYLNNLVHYIPYRPMALMWYGLIFLCGCVFLFLVLLGFMRLF